MEGPPLGPGGEDITWPDQVAPRGRKASSTRKIKPQTSNLKPILYEGHGGSGQGIGYVFLGLNTVRRFVTRGRNHNCRGRVHRSDRPNDWNGYAPQGLT